MGGVQPRAAYDVETIAVVDDDQDTALMASWAVEEAGYEVFPIFEGPYSSVDELADHIAQNSRGAVCDHRLSPLGLASFYGADLVAALYERKIPAILVTQYKEIDKNVSIRRTRDKIPVLLSRDDADASSIREGLARCASELAGHVVPARRPHRVLVRVTYVDREVDAVDVIIPAWNPRQAVRFPLSLVPEELAEGLEQDMRLIALVNIGADEAEELYFKGFELAPEPRDDDGLA